MFKQRNNALPQKSPTRNSLGPDCFIYGLEICVRGNEKPAKDFKWIMPHNFDLTKTVMKMYGDSTWRNPTKR